MEENEVVLSEVHLRWKQKTQEQKQKQGDEEQKLGTKESVLVTSRFPFHVTKDPRLSSSLENDVVDSDVIIIRHALATCLGEVGLQVWSGCLLLCDFLLSSKEFLKSQLCGSHWMTELGAGTGLCSIVAAVSLGEQLHQLQDPNHTDFPDRGLKRIYCTDVGGKVLDLCCENITQNLSLLTDRSIKTELVISEVDFLNYGTQMTQVTQICKLEQQVTLCKLDLKDIAQKCSFFLAADVIFDADITEGFFQLLIDVMTDFENFQGTEKVLYLSLEKRIVFSIHDSLEASSPIYDHFRACLEGLLEMNFGGGGGAGGEIKFQAKQIPIDFHQSFTKSYSRNEFLELWEIKCVKSEID